MPVKSQGVAGGIVIAVTFTLTAAGQTYTPPADVEFLPDRPYREGHEKWKVDIARPTQRAHELPAVLLVHGGGWRGGSRQGQRGIACRYASAGYVAVTIGYRLTGEAPFPACIDDVVAAARWVRANANELGIDPQRIGALGHSAGGHLVCMLALAEPNGGFAPGFLENVSGRVNAVVATAAPTDLVRWEEDRGNSGGTFFKEGALEVRAELARRCSPLTYVDSSAPPTLLLHGSADRTVPAVQSERLVAALRAVKAGLVERLIFDGRPHDFILSYEALIVPLEIAFFERTIGRERGRLAREIATADESRPLRGGGPNAMEWLETFDRDRDGRVTREEFPGGAELFDRFDSAGDGREIRLQTK